MKTDADLESLLRSTLAGRAEGVRAAPPLAALAPKPRRRLVWPAALAAAAAVVAIIASVGIGVHTARKEPAVRPTPTPAAVPRACAAVLPDAWRSALTHAVIDAGGRTAVPLSVADDGSVIALRDDGVHPGDAREVVRLAPGSPPTVLYAIADPDAHDAQAAYLVDHWLFVGLHHNARAPKHTIPGSGDVGLAAIVVVDLDSGHARTLATARPTGLSINSLAVLDGKAYWDERPTYPARNGVVKSYDPRTGDTATVYRGPVGWLEPTGAGLAFSSDRQHPLIPAGLPAPVAAATSGPARQYLATDGTAYAWLRSPRVLGWWAPGHSTPVYLDLGHAVDTRQGALRLLVAGRFVLGADGELVDAASGAAATLDYDASVGLGRTSMYLGRAGVLAGVTETQRRGHWIDGYWADAAMAVLRIDTRALPPLSCR